MLLANDHIIRKQILEVDLNDISDGWQWQERISRFANGALAAKLTECFDQCSAPDEVIGFERLELVLDINSRDDWEQQVLSQVADQLSGIIASKSPENIPLPPKGNSKSVHKLMAAFFHFLQNGQLPWWVSREISNSFEAKLMATLDELNPDDYRTEMSQVVGSPTMLNRLLLQFSKSFLAKLSVVFYQKNHTELFDYQLLTKQITSMAGLPAGELEILFFERVFERPKQGLKLSFHAALAELLTKQPQALVKMQPPDLVKRKELFLLHPELAALGELSTLAASQPGILKKWALQFPNDFKQTIEETLRAGAVPKPVVERFLQGIGDASSGLPEPVQPFLPSKKTTIKTAEEELRSKSLEEESGPTIWPKDTPIPTPKATTQTSAFWKKQEEFFIQNAGLVILHPFLPTLFEELNLSKNGNLEKPERAMHLLHFLVTGRTEPMEHELLLNKICCNWPLDRPVKKRLHLTKREKSEAYNLLRASIRNWPAVGDISLEGLQGSFLYREGKLSAKGEGAWLLQVEQKAYDLLLANLPWGISIVKLPWMTDMIWVEWF